MKQQVKNYMEKIKTTYIHLLILCLTLSLVMCVPKENDMQISYLDQNNNQYRITQDSFWYTPITPEQSSSGTYSGGDPVMKKINETTFSEIATIANTLLENNIDNGVKREMMTSRLTIKKGDSSTSVTLRKSKYRTALETLLKSLK